MARLKTVRLGDLQPDQLFYVDGKEYIVVKNLSPCHVSLRSTAGTLVTIGERTFTRKAKVTTWTCGAEVQIKV